MAWVTFPARADFDAYHLAACATHQIPRPGKLASDNTTVMLDHQWTQAHVNITGAFAAFPGAYLLVQVPDPDVVAYSLTPAPNPPDFGTPENPHPPTILFNGVPRPVLNVAADWMQPKPVSWTDPDTGIVYNVP